MAITATNSDDRPSKKQRELLSYIDAFIKTNGYGPSYREVMNALQYKSVSTVATHIDNLIKKGHLRKRDYSARSLEVVASAASNFKDVSKVSQAQAKWLVDQISTRFDMVEKDPQSASPADIDALYVLVGALQVLGISNAARAFKRKLLPLVSKD